MPSPALVTLDQVSLIYPTATTPALTDVSLSVAQGEFVGVLGRNGSGKSTLGLLLSGLRTPASGTVRWLRTPTENAVILTGATGLKEAGGGAAGATSHIPVGMVFQNPDDQIVGATTAEDAAFGPACLGLPVAEVWRRVEAALSAVGIADLRLRAPAHLSGGERQRLAVADMLALRPGLLVLDEPAAMLDIGAAARLKQVLLELRAQLGLAIVYVTHSLTEVWSADRLLIMDGGRLVWSGTPQELAMSWRRLPDWGIAIPPELALAALLEERGVPVQPSASLTDILEDLCRLWRVH